MTKWIDHSTKCKQPGCTKTYINSVSGYCMEHIPPRKCKWRPGCNVWFKPKMDKTIYCEKHRTQKAKPRVDEDWAALG
jgi:hypothetical protein